MDFATDFLEGAENYYKEDVDTLLELLLDAYKSTGNELFKDRIEEICNDNERCPHCFGSLKITEEKEYRGEYSGFYSYETMYKRICSNCGRRYD